MSNIAAAISPGFCGARFTNIPVLGSITPIAKMRTLRFAGEEFAGWGLGDGLYEGVGLGVGAADGVGVGAGVGIGVETGVGEGVGVGVTAVCAPLCTTTRLAEPCTSLEDVALGRNAIDIGTEVE